MRTRIPLSVSILALLAESASPLSLADLYSALGGVSKSAILRWLQSLVEEDVIVRIKDTNMYALIDKAGYSASSDIVNLFSLKAMASASSRGLTATLYSDKMEEKVPADAFQKATVEFVDKVVNAIYPQIKSVEAAAKTAEVEKLVGTKFSIVVNFNGTQFVSTEDEGLKDLTKVAVNLLSRYGPMSVEEMAKELKLSSVEAYQAVYPLLVAGLADREGDGRIKLLIKVVDEK